ncbi:MAG: sugar ABC transporter ATP-binding protein [Limnochordia bacterium]|jgi:ribose transport system ATP-binding protein
MTHKPMVKFSNVSKAFPGVKALDSVSFEIAKGEIRALVGENGAGKSTLLNILHGVYSEYDGTVEIDGKEVNFRSVQDAIHFGIAKVHQEISYIPELSVGQNITLGYEPRKGLFIDYDKLHEEANAILRRLHCRFRSEDSIQSLSTGEQQMVAIAKALFHNARVISLDEPTASLSAQEANTLFEIIRELKANGITIIYVSHRLDEIFELADSVTILRDGRFIGTHMIADITRDQLIKEMVGRDVSAFAVRKRPRRFTEEVVLEVKGLSVEPTFRDVSFKLRKGEILGFAGLVGSKRTDVVRAIFGADQKTSGEVYLGGKKVEIATPEQGLAHGIGLIPENRKTQGFVKTLNNADNMALASLNKFTRRGFISYPAKWDNCRTLGEATNLNTLDPEYLTEQLSGGNQQKVVLAKWLSSDADILIFDEPTKGVDVGAKEEIYALIEDLVEQGKSIIMVSSELPEIIGMSDRVLVMSEGRIVKKLDHTELTEERILYYAMGEQQ